MVVGYASDVQLQHTCMKTHESVFVICHSFFGISDKIYCVLYLGVCWLQVFMNNNDSFSGKRDLCKNARCRTGYSRFRNIAEYTNFPKSITEPDDRARNLLQPFTGPRIS